MLILQFSPSRGGVSPGRRTQAEQGIGNWEIFKGESTLMTTHLPDEVRDMGYRFKKCIGEGGMNRVYLVEDRSGRSWALKETRAPGEIHSTAAEILRQFNREVELLSSLSHPHLPAYRESFSAGTHHYLVEEYIDGITLEQYCAQTIPGQLEVIDLAITLCTVLSYLHGKGIIFRDLKPANIMLTGDGKLKLLDFDIARRYRRGKKSDTVNLGTPGFAAPETYGTSQSDARSDIYSLGATLHSLLTGIDPQDHPFRFDPVDSIRRDVDSELLQAITKALAARPQERFQSCDAFRKALRRIRARLSPAPSTLSRLTSFLSRSISTLTRGLRNPGPSPPPQGQASGTITQQVPGPGILSYVKASMGAIGGMARQAQMLLESLKEGDMDLVRALVETGADLTYADEMGRTPLHWAVINGDTSLAGLLISRGASASIPDNSGLTPLWWAVFYRQEPILQLFVMHGIDINERDKASRTFLHRVVLNGDRVITRFLVDHGAQLNARNAKGWTPLHMAAHRGNLEIMRILIDAGARIDETNNQGRTPFHCAITRNRQSAAELLLERGADRDAWDYRGRSALHMSSYLGLRDITAFLISRGMEVNERDKKKQTPLHSACDAGMTSLAELLLTHGAGVNDRDENGWPPLFLAALADPSQHPGGPLGPGGRASLNLKGTKKLGAWRESLIKILARYGATLTATDNQGRTALHITMQRGFLEGAETLSALGFSMSAMDIRGRTPLHLLFEEAPGGSALEFLRKHREFSLSDPVMQQYLFRAIRKKEWELSRLLVECGVSAGARDGNGKSVLHHNLPQDLAEFLILKGAEVKAPDRQGATPLLAAVERGEKALATVLLTHGADVHQKAGSSGTLLSLAVERKDTAMVRVLLGHGADARGKGAAGKSLLSTAVEKGPLGLVTMLVEHGANIHEADRRGMTPLHRAAEKGNPAVVEYLIKSGVEINCRNERGRTPLYFSSTANKEVLLMYGARM